MKTKNILITAFVVVAIIQLAVPAKMIHRYESILSKGKEYKFQIAPVDPSDPFRGKYITIWVKESSFETDSLKPFVANQDIYVILGFDETHGFAKIKDIACEKPLYDIDFVKAKVRYAYKSSITIEYPFNRYYLEESLAPKIERIYNEALRDTTKANYVVVNSVDGNAVINDLVINGKSVKEIK